VQLFPVLSGLWLYYTIRAELQTANDLAAQLLRLGNADDRGALKPYAHLAAAITAMDRGELTDALAHATAAGSHAILHPASAIPAVLGRICWALGDADAALAHAETGVTRARATGHPQPLGFALTFAAIVAHLRGEVERTRAYAEESAALSREHGLVQTLAWARLWRGWATAQRGHRAEGIQDMREALAAYRAIGSEISRPQFLALLAEALGDEGHADEALALLAEALGLVEATGERFIEAEIHRLRGHLLLQQSPHAAPEAARSIQRALEIASRQQARGWERLARESLASLALARFARGSTFKVQGSTF
jgi:predicted ATPase